MTTENLITKVTRVLQRENGSEARIVAQTMFGEGLHPSLDVFVLMRESSTHNWKLCSSTPHPDWRTMSVEDYIKNGRSEMLQTVTPGEILKVTALLGQPMTRFENSIRA